MLPTTRHLLRKGQVQDCILLFCYPQVTSRLYTTVLLPRDPLLECILLFCYAIANYLTVYYCSVTHRPTTRLYATVLVLTDTLPYCILLSCYLHSDYQTVYHCSVTYRSISRLLVDVHCTHKLTNRLYTTVLLPTGPLPDWILLFYYPHADCQTVYYCSFTDVPSTKLYTTVPLPSGPLTDCIPLP